MPPPRLPETLEQTVKAEFRTALADEPFAVAELGTHAEPPRAPNWTLEWSLPGWLGATLGWARDGRQPDPGQRLWADHDQAA
ncbi:MAG: hypothetical protein HZY76_20080 [Anaerolineae bacterium]|nr:MAG: hypothetical protein HZY76_20080 [Anaerolineae bacterium]